MLALVMKCSLNMLGIGNMMSQVTFTGIVIVQYKHVMTTILITCDGMDPFLFEFTLEITCQKSVTAMRIGFIILTSEEHKQSSTH